MLLLRASWPYRLWDFFSPRLLVVVPTVTSLGCHLGRSVNFLKAKHGWLRFRIHMSCPPMARRRTRPAGCVASQENNSRCLQLTVRIWVVQFAGFPSPACLCVPATAERTIGMAHALPAHRNAVFLNIPTKSRTA